MATHWRPQVAGDVPEHEPAPVRTTRTLRLYECTAELDRVRELLAESEDGELTPDMEALLDRATGNFADKAEAVALVVREFQADEKAINDEAARLAKRARTRGRAAERLRAYLHRQMAAADVGKVEGRLVTVRLQKNSRPSVLHTYTPEQVAALQHDATFAPFVRVVPAMWHLDTDAVLAAWKAAQPIPEGVTVEVGSHVRIA